MKKTIWALSFFILIFSHLQYAIGETVNVGIFRYLPYEEGKVKEDQVENTSARSIILKQGVAEIFTQEIVSAMSSMGITIEGSSARTVQGTIKKVFVDDMRMLVHYSLEIGFEILDGTNKDTVYSRSFSSFRSEPKAPFTRKMARQMIKNCVKNFVKDARKKGVL